MVILSDYQEFAGAHWETGTIRNVLAYQGVTATHTGQPISEALLLGISGGIAVGYFTFEYQGYLPHLVLLTRNTFDPMETLLDRLAIPRDVVQTTKAGKGDENLLRALEDGRPAIVWADMFTLPYNQLPYDEHNWAVRPVLVFGVDNEQAYLADRANRPLVVPAATLHQARARISKYRFRVMTLGAPDLGRLPEAVRQGIQQCIALYLDKPPKGKGDNFGLAALQYWARMLTNTRNKQSWARYFPAGPRLWMALAGDVTQPGVCGWIRHGAGNSAERGMYADFLTEAALILDQPGLNEASVRFRQSEAAWDELACRMLPAEVPLCNETAALLTRKRALFYAQGAEAADEIANINDRLTAIHQEVTADFPLSDTEIGELRERMAVQLVTIHVLERDAVECMQAVMA